MCSQADWEESQVQSMQVWDIDPTLHGSDVEENAPDDRVPLGEVIAFLAPAMENLEDKLCVEESWQGAIENDKYSRTFNSDIAHWMGEAAMLATRIELVLLKKDAV